MRCACPSGATAGAGWNCTSCAHLSYARTTRLRVLMASCSHACSSAPMLRYASMHECTPGVRVASLHIRIPLTHHARMRTRTMSGGRRLLLHVWCLAILRFISRDAGTGWLQAHVTAVDGSWLQGDSGQCTGQPSGCPRDGGSGGRSCGCDGTTAAVAAWLQRWRPQRWRRQQQCW